ncbi:hypothetical protein SPHINGOR109_10200 [Sphingorhabdus sp. 109]|nr:hypothetical protein SPHINGOR109_10200 [Sphingorhabdus sp. 109]
MEDGDAAVEQQQHAECLANPDRFDFLGLDDRAGQPVSVEEIEKNQNHLGHCKDSVIFRIEDTDYRQSGPPGYDLGQYLGARTPENRASYTVSEIAVASWGGSFIGHVEGGLNTFSSQETRVYRAITNIFETKMQKLC